MSDFVNFKLAQKLKDKGFRKPCILYYNSDKVRTWFNEPHIAKDFVPTTLGNDDVLAPTISQVLKWLRDDKKLHIEFVGNACGYLYIVSDIPSEGGTDRYCSDYSGPNDGGTWDKYEDCALNAIQYVLDNFI